MEIFKVKGEPSAADHDIFEDISVFQPEGNRLSGREAIHPKASRQSEKILAEPVSCASTFFHKKDEVYSHQSKQFSSVCACPF